jgi:hypothetical protein
MRRITMLLPFCLAAAAAAGPALAQCRLCDKAPNPLSAQAQVGSDVDLQIDTNLNFDRIIFGGAGSGAAVLRPDGLSSVQGDVLEVSGRAMVASVRIHGDPGRMVEIDLPQRVDLYSANGARITLDSLSNDLTSIPRLDSAGNLNIRIGGRITIVGEADGQFRGEMAVSARYQ